MLVRRARRPRWRVARVEGRTARVTWGLEINVTVAGSHGEGAESASAAPARSVQLARAPRGLSHSQVTVWSELLRALRRGCPGRGGWGASRAGDTDDVTPPSRLPWSEGDPPSLHQRLPLPPAGL